ncbi:MBL fold metallo-hydrolase [Ammoniphilus sp. CFH 90114]|uniref:MBL fold metallo-hydrolase n=1 Tax=Ammoniphilus sp. CFH 90114 TaxID=2493665 RepID=UPI00100DB8A5|nr:MBL fold metallo-hydrolase [Ammoniphilus sp. CFH 90114]RXT03601.1 MBL fold metallo-hydrolase [Ammoniphilus sp. CFH 90114]
MELIQVKEKIFYLKGAVNIGLLKGDNGVIVIDTGLDKSSAGRIDKVIQSWNSTLLHIMNTHSHADHFGGNRTLLKKYPNSKVWAPSVEEAFIRYPELEGISLFSGATPPKELQNKFLKGEASRVDIVIEEDFTIDEWKFEVDFVPGHAHQQLTLTVDGVCFAGDGYFGIEVMKKHKIPFLVDADQAVKSCEKILHSDSSFYIPGHGNMESRTEVAETIRFNVQWHQDNMDRLIKLIDGYSNGATTDELVAALSHLHEIMIDNMTSYVLYQTAVMGYLRSLHAQQRIEIKFHQNSWRWMKK